MTLPERTIIYIKGQGKWDAAFETLVDAFKSLNEYLDKQGIKPAGPAMTIYTETDDTGFSFEAAYVDRRSAGRAAERRHRGRARRRPARRSNSSIAAPTTPWIRPTRRSPITSTTSISSRRDLFIEEYVTDPVKTNAENLMVNVFVPVK